MDYIDEVNNNPSTAITQVELEHNLHEEVNACDRPSAVWLFKCKEVWT